MTNIHAEETIEREVETLLPEELQDILATQALEELNEAKKVPFTPQQDAKKLENLIEQTQKKIDYLMSLCVVDLLQQESTTPAKIEDEDGEIREITLVEGGKVSLHDIVRLENTIASAIKRYESVLSNAMKQRRLLSGQMYGTRLSHSAQISRMKRIRKISLTGEELQKQLGHSMRDHFTSKTEIPKTDAKKGEVIDLFPKEQEGGIPTFEPYPDTLPFEQQITSQVAPQHTQSPEKQERKKQSSDNKKDSDLYCSSYED